MSGDVLGVRALNRATLQRQGLLQRQGSDVAETVEHLVGMQAQNPHDPYYALWARLETFEPGLLSEMIEGRTMVRAAMMRATIHLFTAADYRVVRPLFQGVLERVFGSTSFAKDIAGVDRLELLAEGHRLLKGTPLTRAGLAELLGERWPGPPHASLAQAVTYLTPLVQVPPRGIWGSSGAARWALAEEWLGVEPAPAMSVDDLLIRYLGAFGPASVADMRVWSGLSGLREVADRLRPELRMWRDEKGHELLDLADVELPDEDIPAPPRFLPEYDNLLLGHSDRSRFFRGPTPQGWVGNLLIDGFYAGSWKLHHSNDGSLIEVSPQVKLSKNETTEVEEEAHRLATNVGIEVVEMRVNT